MGFLDNIKNAASSAFSNLQDGVKKFQNKEFKEAVVSACALVAAADGTIDDDEKTKMLDFMRNSEALKVFDVADIAAVFQDIAGKIQADKTLGKAEALQKIGRLKGKDEQARLMVRVACAIGESDGSFDADEQAVVQEICKELGLNPDDFGVMTHQAV